MCTHTHTHTHTRHTHTLQVTHVFHGWPGGFACGPHPTGLEKSNSFAFYTTRSKTMCELPAGPWAPWTPSSNSKCYARRFGQAAALKPGQIVLDLGSACGFAMGMLFEYDSAPTASGLITCPGMSSGRRRAQPTTRCRSSSASRIKSSSTGFPRSTLTTR
jgi:hypothetical protein